jgi:hypothetical protein
VGIREHLENGNEAAPQRHREVLLKREAEPGPGARARARARARKQGRGRQGNKCKYIDVYICFFYNKNNL